MSWESASGVTIITLSLADLLTILTASAKALDLRIYFYYCRNIEEVQRLMLKKQNLALFDRCPGKRLRRYDNHFVAADIY